MLCARGHPGSLRTVLQRAGINSLSRPRYVQYLTMMSDRCQLAILLVFIHHMIDPVQPPEKGSQQSLTLQGPQQGNMGNDDRE